MCDKAVLENGGTLKCVPDCYKSQEICNKVVDNYPHALEFDPECYKTQKICNKAADTHPPTIKIVAECYKNQEMCCTAVHICCFVFASIPDQCKSQELCETIVSLSPDKYITQKMFDEVVDNSLAALKIIFDWFLTSKTIKIFYTAQYANDGLLYFDEISGDVTFCCDEMDVLSVNLSFIYFNKHFDEADHDTIILFRLFAWHIKFKNLKAFKTKDK